MFYWQTAVPGFMIGMNETTASAECFRKTDAERMSNALRAVLTVSKSELLKKEARVKRVSEKKRAKKASWLSKLA
jgi:hypothetical protein